MSRDELIEMYGIETCITINHDVREISIYTNKPELMDYLQRLGVKCIRQDVVEGKVFGGLYIFQSN
ncbi:hypothetical protein HZF24_11895 [Sedimentibacter hydroxybenzoicus DSM 7310]|uniref:Uncharacterized protein n=1 Tax=Sedimentibacter hydroxybenzoicus DSM 7310 TaxID=1123245 RepID=A0A974BLJ3_SEDHY|nr:hypothetical protein [Sedimentibacter hydroxybenzoicus]NYB74840.1 hypothetical protein [Sedimentibacter hydroxybenzoicus DSM 7310]